MNEVGVANLSMSQLRKLGENLNLSFTSEIRKADLEGKIICRLEWLARSSYEKLNSASGWDPPSEKVLCSSKVSLDKSSCGARSPHVTDTLFPSKEQSEGRCLQKVIESLRAENNNLKSSLQKSESRRREIEIKLNQVCFKGGLESRWQELINSNWTSVLKAWDDDEAGLLFNLSD